MVNTTPREAALSERVRAMGGWSGDCADGRGARSAVGIFFETDREFWMPKLMQ